jgi:hypothetical protein
MTKYEIAVRLLAEYCDCPSKDGITVDLPMKWCENYCKYDGDDIGHEETLQCWEKVINDRYEAQGEEDKKEPCEDAISRQAAIDDLYGKDPSQIWDTADIEVWVNGLQSTQPEKVKCEKCRYVYYDKEFGNYWCNRMHDAFMVEKGGYCKWGK